MIRRIRVSGYKSLRQVELRLGSLCCFVGPNASGKSNLLDVLQLLSRLATAPTLKDAFDSPHRGRPLEAFAFDEAGVHGLLGRDRLEFRIEVDLDLAPNVVELVERQIRDMRHGIDTPAAHASAKQKSRKPYVTEKRLRYRVVVEMIPKTGVLRVKDEYLAPLSSDGSVSDARKPFLEQTDGRLCLRMEGQSRPTLHELGLNHTILSRPLYPPHYPHITAARREIEGWAFFYFEPRERMRAPNPVGEVEHMGLMGENLAAFLHTMRAQNDAQFRSIVYALRALIPSIEDLTLETNKLGEVELGIVENGVSFSSRVLSEGTLRVLGLLAVTGMREKPALIGIEEPENGIHPRRVGLVARVFENLAQFSGSQVIITTHSPYLAEAMGPEHVYACKKLRGATAIQALQSLGPLVLPQEVDEALDDHDVATPFAERLIRGDFDA